MMIRNKNGEVIKPLVDKYEYYNGFIIESILLPMGVKAAKLYFPRVYKKDFNIITSDKVLSWITRIFNTLDDGISIWEEDNTAILYVLVGCGSIGSPYVLLPETYRAKEYYGNRFNSTSDFNYENVISSKAPLEYTPKMVINCGKRFADLFINEANGTKLPEPEQNLYDKFCESGFVNTMKTLIADKSTSYKDFTIDTGVDEIGNRFARIYLRNEEDRIKVSVNWRELVMATTRLGNSTVTDLNDDFYSFMLGCNSTNMNEYPIGLPNVRLANSMYKNALPEHLKRFPELYRNHLMMSYRTVEYTADTALNCARRIVDKIFASFDRFSVRVGRKEHKNFLSMIGKQSSSIYQNDDEKRIEVKL